MLSIVGRCENGEQLAHEWSRPYPQYTPEETQRKVTQALRNAGPRTCEYIRRNLNGEPYCRDCLARDNTVSPIGLGSIPATEVFVIANSAARDEDELAAADSAAEAPGSLPLDSGEIGRSGDTVEPFPVDVLPVPLARLITEG